MPEKSACLKDHFYRTCHNGAELFGNPDLLDYPYNRCITGKTIQFFPIMQQKSIWSKPPSSRLQ
jgi:hypothetical protein